MRKVAISCLTALALIGAAPACDENGPPGRTEPVGAPWFEQVAVARGLAFEHDSGHGERYLFPEIACGGAALFDMDLDGDLDAYLVQAGSLVDPGVSPPNRLYRNEGSGAFADVTAGSGADDCGYGMGVATGDHDNDGDVDLYVTNVGANVLLQNQGGGGFTDVTTAARTGESAWSTSAAFFDYDADGDLDLFVANYIYWSIADELSCQVPPYGADYCSPNSYQTPAADTLYRNEGDGSFRDVSLDAGIRAAFGNGLGVVCGDFDSDGRADVFVANDGMMNQLWMNEGDGYFRDQAMRAGCAVDQDGIHKAGMGVAVADLDDDGDEDLIVANLGEESDSAYANEGRFFRDRTARWGLAVDTRAYTGFGIGLVDFDNDGYLDLYQANGRVQRPRGVVRSSEPYGETNQLFRGRASGGFEHVLPPGGVAEPLIATSRAAAFGDVDGDGSVDVLVVNRDAPAHLLINRGESGGTWVSLRVLEEHGRDALGVRVTARLGERRITRCVRSAYSYCAASDARIHIGLGTATRLDGVVVQWVDGTRESFGSLAAPGHHELRRGQGRAEGDAR